LKDREPPNKVARVAARLDVLWLLVLMIGAYGAGFGWRPGAYFLLASLLGLLLGHLVMGITEYRRVMGRPWPKVAPLDDDEDW